MIFKPLEPFSACSRGVIIQKEIIIFFTLFKKKFQTCYSLFLILFLFLLSGCVSSSDFDVKNLAKTNIDIVSDVHLNEATTLLKTLTRKLYKKNPAELKKIPGQSVDKRIQQIFTCPAQNRHKELDYKNGTDAILLGFEPKFEGDRVFAMMYGLYTMIHASYNNKCELFVLDYLDEQNLYNSARNIEVFVWRLNNRQKDDGSVFLITNSIDSEHLNLSYERIFGKLISVQDTMAKIVETWTGRTIKQVVQMAGMAFLPIGF